MSHTNEAVPIISVVVTLMNEEDNIEPLLEQVYAALANLNYELILVDDGSTDRTVEKIKELANDQTTLVIFNRNYGQTTAMAAGIEYAKGEYIATIDGDLQNDPSDIPAMLKMAIEENWDVVAGHRKNRKDGAFLRKIPSRIANRMIRNLTGVHLKDYGCTLKVFKSTIAKNLGLYGELHRFIPVLSQIQGAKLIQVDVKHHPRIHGQSKYGLGRTFKVMSDLFLIVFLQKYFRRPIHLFGPLGILSFTAGILINLYLLIIKLLGEDIWGRPLLILGITLLLAGIQFLTFGLIVEIIMRIYFEAQSKPTFNVREVYKG
jgi:glycosyltransferase involved in cell wall biosynthesis